MIGLKRLIYPLSIIIMSLLLTTMLVMIAEMSVLATEPVAKVDSVATLGNGFVLRFDPSVAQFQVITLPIVAGRPRQPHSLVTIANSANEEIWYTDPGADKIGRLIYTMTNKYAFTEFDLPAGSEPFDLVANNEYIWFTAKGSNWIGRLEINTTQLVTFPVPTANSAPWSIDIGSDNSIWFTEKASSKLGRLIVTDTNNYSFIEYPTLGTDAQPQGLTVVNQTQFDLVWYSETVSPTQIVLLDLAQLPPGNFIAIKLSTNPSYAVNLANRGKDIIWFTDLLANNLNRVVLGTSGFIISYSVPTANSQPYDLAIDSNKDVWFTERIGGHLGRRQNGTLVPDEYPIPTYLTSGWLQGIVLDSQNHIIWLAGFVPRSVYLPTILKGQ